MATGIEYTQFFSYTASGAGSTGYQYFQLGNTLQTAGSVFVIKYLSVSSTSGITNTSPAYALQVVSATDDSGTGLIKVLSNNSAPVAASIPIIVLNNISQQDDLNVGNQIILNQNYIGINVNMVGAGTFTATICYSLIPAANPLVGNFGILSEASSSNLPVLNSGTSTRILKSAIVSNFDTTETYTAQFVLYTGGTVSSYLSEEYTLAPGDSVCYSLPFYLTTSTSLALYSLQTLFPGGVGLSSYCSYLKEAI